MTTRIYSHKHQLYTNSLNWPSNQRTWSDWAVAPDGRILEIIHIGLPDRGDGDSYDDTVCQYYDPRNFSIEPWTGFFDSAGKKIYRGDILEMESMYHFKSEVTWQNGAFWLKALDSQGTDQQFDGIFSKYWTITGNIHDAEFSS